MHNYVTAFGGPFAWQRGIRGKWLWQRGSPYMMVLVLAMKADFAATSAAS